MSQGLEVLSIRLHLKEDAAGATFIALGSSAPVLMLTFVTIIRGTDYIDIGFGAIIGYVCEWDGIWNYG